MTRAVVITEEVPEQYYQWFVALSTFIPRRKFELLRMRHFSSDPCPRCSRYEMPKFGRLEDAKVWCADRGLLWEVRRNEEAS